MMNWIKMAWAMWLIVLSGIVQPVFAAPTIEVWSGNNQQYGVPGLAQPYINVLGRVSDSSGVASLSYTLNGGAPVTLSIGPDEKRLQAAGDFNADIPVGSLLNGSNQVVIQAASNNGSATTQTINIQYTANRTWPLPYNISWSSVSSIPQVAQIVDGLWSLPGNGARTARSGYDRILAVGDTSWVNYEVQFPVTIHSMEDWAHIGIMAHFNGNSDDPFPGWQPKSGWNPIGAFCWYNHAQKEMQIYDKTGPGDVFGNQNYPGVTPISAMQPGNTYNFKLRAQSTGGSGGLYSCKAWPAGQAEPANWSLIYQGSTDDPEFGGIGLMMYYADVTIGNVTVVPVSAAGGGSTGGGSTTASTLKSDDFNSSSLNTSVWTFRNPSGDGSLNFSGTGSSSATADISVPAGTSHDAWNGGIDMPHIMQSVNDTDFEVEVKFASGVSSAWQIQGLMVKQDDTNFLRFDFYGTGSGMAVFGGSVLGGTGEFKINVNAANGSPLYMRVKRQGSTWTLQYSYNGSDWVVAGSFVRAMNVTEVGLHASNYVPNPAHTASIDYFWNRALTNSDDAGTPVVTPVVPPVVTPVVPPVQPPVSGGTADVYVEDAEDGATTGWQLYDSTPAGASISNVQDAQLGSRVIQLSGAGLQNGYRFSGDSGAGLGITSQFEMQWQMKTSETYEIFVAASTSRGARYFYYTPRDGDLGLLSSVYVHRGLGSGTTDGTWRTYTRDLQADLSAIEPGNTLQSVSLMMVRGNMRLDGIGYSAN